MVRRLLGFVVVLWGLTGAAYLVWCQHRISFPVLMTDRAWPRPLPYPDGLMGRWYDRLEAANPVAPGVIKCGGEWYHLQGRVRAWTLSALVAPAMGVAILLWTPAGWRRSRWPSVRRGIAIGLVVGIAWAALLGHQGHEGARSVCLSLAVWGVGFTVAGAVVGAMRHYPELVGSGSGFLVVEFAGLVVPSYDRSDFLGWDQRITKDFLDALMNMNNGPAELVILGGCGLFWGLVIGALHRLFRSEEAAARRLPSPSWRRIID